MGVDRRIVGLDAWRALLLLGGPITHAANYVKMRSADPSPWATVEWSTHVFRMQAFFFISGLVSTMAQTGRPDWKWRRFAQLGFPLVSTWLFVLIPTELLTTSDVTAKMFAGPQHLWFLCVLLVATGIALAIDGTLRRVAAFADRQSLLTIVVFWSFVAAVLASSGAFATATISHKMTVSAVTTVYRYGMCYLAGVVVALSPRLLDQIRTTRLWIAGPIAWVASLVLHAYAYQPWLNGEGAALQKGAVEVSVGVTSVLMYVCIVHTALRMSKIPAWLWRFSRAAFTVYLFHYVIIELFTLLPRSARDGDLPLFVLVAYTSLTLSLVVHRVFVRYAWFRVFFIGRLEGPIRDAIDRFGRRHDDARVVLAGG